MRKAIVAILVGAFLSLTAPPAYAWEVFSFTGDCEAVHLDVHFDVPNTATLTFAGSVEGVVNLEDVNGEFSVPLPQKPQGDSYTAELNWTPDSPESPPAIAVDTSHCVEEQPQPQPSPSPTPDDEVQGGGGGHQGGGGPITDEVQGIGFPNEQPQASSQAAPVTGALPFTGPRQWVRFLLGIALMCFGAGGILWQLNRRA
jgi:hypothetical protein